MDKPALRTRLYNLKRARRVLEAYGQVFEEAVGLIRVIEETIEREIWGDPGQDHS